MAGAVEVIRLRHGSRVKAVGCNGSRRMAGNPAKRSSKKKTPTVVCRRCERKVPANEKGLPYWHDAPAGGRCLTAKQKAKQHLSAVA